MLLHATLTLNHTETAPEVTHNHFRANPLPVKVTLGTGENFNTVTKVVLDLKPLNAAESDLPLSRTILTDFDPDTTEVTLTLTGSQMNWAPGPYEIIASALQPNGDSIQELYTLNQSRIQLHPHKYSETTPAPPEVATTQLATTAFVFNEVDAINQAYAPAISALNASVGALDTRVGSLESDYDGVATALAEKAPLASPALTGTPTAPTAALSTNTTQLATTAFVFNEVDAINQAYAPAISALNASVALKAPVSTTVTLTGPQTITNKSIAASQLTGTIAAARLTGALTIPGPIGGTTPSTINCTTLTSDSPTSGIQIDVKVAGVTKYKVTTGTSTRVDLGTDGIIQGNWATASITLNSNSTHLGNGAPYGANCLKITGGPGLFSSDVNTFVVADASNPALFRDLKLRCLKIDRTDPASGTTGNQTINKAAGTVRFAAGATTIVITNSLATATTFAQATVNTNDATAAIKSVVTSAGAITITLTTAATAETIVSWFLLS